MGQPAPKYPVDLDAETPVDREARLAWERERIAEAEASYRAGDFVADEDLDVWLDAWVAGQDVR